VKSVRQKAFIFALGFTLPFLFAGAQASESEYRDVLSITDVVQNIVDPGNDPEICGNFKLSTKQLLHYFKNAREGLIGTYAHDLDYAPCHVTGKLMLKSGITATWKIELSGRGSIDFDDGRYMFLDCEHCVTRK
jgi:hypothetical protein